MNFDSTISVWHLVVFLVLQGIPLIGYFFKQDFKIKALETSLKASQSDIRDLEDSLNTEVKTIHQSIGEINSGLKQLNNYIQLILEGKINTEPKAK